MTTLELRPRDLAADRDAIGVQLTRLEGLRGGGVLGVAVPSRSRWGVGQHALHVALAAAGAARLVGLALRGRAAEPEPTGELALEVLTTRAIPRGIAEAPVPLRVESAPSGDELAAAVEEARDRWARLDGRDEEIAAATGVLPHPLLGPLPAAAWVRFTAVHGAHHLAIVSEVLLGG